MVFFECFFRVYFKKVCGVFGWYKDQIVFLFLKICLKDVLYYLKGCYKIMFVGVEVEWKFCLYRVGLFDEVGEFFIICFFYRDEFGFGW